MSNTHENNRALLWPMVGQFRSIKHKNYFKRETVFQFLMANLSCTGISLARCTALHTLDALVKSQVQRNLPYEVIVHHVPKQLDTTTAVMK